MLNFKIVHVTEQLEVKEEGQKLKFLSLAKS
jgi:hypothetical protein